MLFCIGVYDTRKEIIREMRERLVGCSVRTDRDFEILWMTDASAAEKMETYALKMQLALISLDSPEGRHMGEQIYSFNPDCRICYYKSKKCDLEPLLPSRPISFYLWEQEPDVFGRKLEGLLREITGSGKVFFYETRKTSYVFGVRDILYFQSSLKYVEIHTRSREECSVFAKLSEIERRLKDSGLEECFLRIHKSYIVNIIYIEALDKAGRMVKLSGGEQLPVSDAWYAHVAKRLSGLQ